jgi:phosphatidate cytidylyltransferase
MSTSYDPPKNGTRARSNLATRILTAVIGAPLILLLLFFGPVWAWTALVFGAIALSASEFFHLSHPGDEVARAFGVIVTVGVSAVVFFCRDDPRALLTLVAALPLLSIVFALVRLGDVRSSVARMAATTFGPLWLGLLTFIALLRATTGALGPGYVLMTLMFAWLADSAGYFAGRFLGRRQLYPAVSPKKTVEGLLGAIAGAIAGALLAHFGYLPQIPLIDALALAVTAGLLGQLGDLGESLLKRGAGVKDSGEIVPGHGGMLDRLDALFVTSALVYLYTRWR